MDKSIIKAALAEAIQTIDKLADQQAMPDPFYNCTFVSLARALDELENDKH